MVSLQSKTLDFAAWGFGECIRENDAARIFVGRYCLLDVILEGFDLMGIAGNTLCAVSYTHLTLPTKA